LTFLSSSLVRPSTLEKKQSKTAVNLPEQAALIANNHFYYIQLLILSGCFRMQLSWMTDGRRFFLLLTYHYRKQQTLKAAVKFF